MQGSRDRIDAERAHTVSATARADTSGRRTASAPSDIKVVPRGMRPRILDITRKRHGTSLDQDGVLNVYVVLGELSPYAGVERDSN